MELKLNARPLLSKIEPGRFYRIDEVAKYLAVSVSTVRRELNNPDSGLKPAKIRGCIRVSGGSLLTYIQAQQVDNYA